MNDNTTEQITDRWILRWHPFHTRCSLPQPPIHQCSKTKGQCRRKGRTACLQRQCCESGCGCHRKAPIRPEGSPQSSTISMTFPIIIVFCNVLTFPRNSPINNQMLWNKIEKVIPVLRSMPLHGPIPDNQCLDTGRAASHHMIVPWTILPCIWSTQSQDPLRHWTSCCRTYCIARLPIPQTIWGEWWWRLQSFLRCSYSSDSIFLTTGSSD